MCVHAYVKIYDIKFSKGQAFTYTILFTFLNIYVKYKNKIWVSIQCQKESNSDMICTTINIKNVKTHKKLERQSIHEPCSSFLQNSKAFVLSFYYSSWKNFMNSVFVLFSAVHSILQYLP